jgi:MOSC domain-containing protein YiiM
MRIVSVNTSLPKEILWEGKSVRSSIFKRPQKGILNVGKLGVGNDTQCESKYHGGFLKAIYSYDSAYYALWKKSIDFNEWTAGMFGENLTTEGLQDDKVLLGNIYQAGTVQFKAIQPRIPCFKLNIPFNRKDIFSRFFEMPGYGTYYQVLQTGSLQAGDTIELIHASDSTISIADLVACYATRGADQKLLKKVLNCPFFPEGLRGDFEKFLRQ